MLVTIFLRTVLFYFTVLVVTRVMGKREIAQLSPIDLVVAIMMAESAVVAIEDTDKPLLAGIVPIVTLMVAQILFAKLTLRSRRLRALINGTPTLLVKHGKLVERQMRASRISIHDLLEQIRQSGVHNLTDVEFAILETSGTLSVIPKAESQALSPNEAGVKVEPEKLPITIIAHGELDERSLDSVNLDRQWLDEQLENHGLERVSQVLYAGFDSKRNFYLQPLAEYEGEGGKEESKT